MNVIECRGAGGVDTLFASHRPKPIPTLSEVGIRVLASGVNRPDLMQRKGLYPPPKDASDILGLEIAGLIETGDADRLSEFGLAVGDAVCALTNGGGYADYCVVPIAQCLPVPKGWTMTDAAGIPETFFTVWSNLVEIAKFQSGQSILIHGGAGGIGVAAIQIAKQALGAKTVFVTAGTDEKCQVCCELGADVAINYNTSSFEETILDATNGQGVDVVLDILAGEYLNRNLKCLAPDGQVIVIALQNGRNAMVDGARLLMKRLKIQGSTLRARSLAYKAEIAKNLKQSVWPLLEEKKIIPVIHQIFNIQHDLNAPCSAAQMAHTMMESSQHIGKIILNWDLK